MNTAPTIYNYCPSTKEFTGTGLADANPVRANDWIFPAHCTQIKPMDAGPNKRAVFKGTEWVLMSDYRGVEYWMPDGVGFRIGSLGLAPPVGSSPTRPEIAQAVAEEPPKALPESDTETARSLAYANPTTGSDRLFAEAMRMQAMGEIGHEEVKARAVERYKEIRSQYPWP